MMKGWNNKRENCERVRKITKKQCCRSGFFSIPDPGSDKKKQGKNKLVVLPVLVDNYLIF
jgi:hypothetical protein